MLCFKSWNKDHIRNHTYLNVPDYYVYSNHVTVRGVATYVGTLFFRLVFSSYHYKNVLTKKDYPGVYMLRTHAAGTH